MKRFADIAILPDSEDSVGIALGWCAPIGRARLSEALLAFASRHRAVTLGVHEMAPAALIAGLRRRTLDVIVLPGASHPEFAAVALWAEPIRIAVSARDAIAMRDTVAASDLVDMLFLLPPSDPMGAIHRLLAEHLGAPHLRLQATLRSTGPDFDSEAIAAGAGASLFCGEWTGAVDRGVVVRPLAGPDGEISLHAQWIEADRHPFLEELLELLVHPKGPVRPVVRR